MRIRLEPTHLYDPEEHPQHPYQHSVQIVTPNDDLNIQDVRVLLEAALVAWGFHPDTIKDIFIQE